MPDSVLADTSVWIEAGRHPTGPIGVVMKKLIASDRIVLAAPVWTELRIGAKSPPDLECLEGYRKELRWVDLAHDTWLRAGELGARLRKLGATVPTLDILIAQLAIDSDSPIFTLDQDFQHISKHAALTLYSEA